jgi:hypothetical protein
MFKDVDLAGIGIEGSSDLADELSTMPAILWDPSLDFPAARYARNSERRRIIVNGIERRERRIALDG